MISMPGKRARAFSSTITQSEEVVTSAYNRFRNDTEFTSGSSEWLQDNYYIVQRAVRQIREDLPGKFYRQLPLAESPELADNTRVFSICRSISGDDELDLARMTRLLKNLQKTIPLSIGEIWAIPSMLRFCNLLKLAESLSVGIDGSAEEEAVSICIGNFRFLDQVDWKEFFEKVSLVEKELKRDPAGIYLKMDFQTRNSYRNVIEAVSRRTGISETRLASCAVDLAEKGPENHVGFYLLTCPGVKLLRASCGFSRRYCSVPAGLKLAFYLGAILLISSLILLLSASLAAGAGVGAAELLLLLILGIIPVSAMAIDVVNEIILHAKGPVRLPGMDFRKGIPSSCRTAVVIPCILGSRDDTASLAKQRERHFLGNRDKNLDFALLSDFRDAHSEQMPEDEEVLTFA